MSLGGLAPSVINFITGNLDVSDLTRAELRNFLNGKITTVADEGEFADALRTITQNVEVAGTVEEGTFTGEVLGALEGGAAFGLIGGALVFRGAEIASDLFDLASGSDAETRARINQAAIAGQLASAGMIHGGLGTPSANASNLIQQAAENERLERNKGEGREIPADRNLDIGSSESRPFNPIAREPLTDETFPLLDDAPAQVRRGDKLKDKLKDALSDAERAALAAAAAGIAAGSGLINKGRNLPIPAVIPTLKPSTPTDVVPTDNPTDDNKPFIKIAVSQAGELRPSFKQTGTSYIDKTLNTPISIQNSEWAEFDYVTYDRQNQIQVENLRNKDIRFQEPLFKPRYVKPLEKPSKLSVKVMQYPMKRELQITQSFVDKFEGADMGQEMEFTDTYNHSVIPANFLNLELYNFN